MISVEARRDADPPAVGYPMGTPESHLLPVGYCAWNEWTFRKLLGADTRYIRVKRYVGNANVATFYHRHGGYPTIDDARALIDRWKAECYDSNLTLEQTSESEFEYEFLDGI